MAYPQRRYSGTVGICAQDAGRFTEFALSLGRLDLPAGWDIQGALNLDFAHAANFLAESFKGDHLFFMDDDNSFPPDIVRRLLAHDVDIVGPLCLERKPPFAPIPRIAGAPLAEIEVGLQEVDETGTAGLLVRRHVFEALEMPYFWAGDDEDGYTQADHYFCARAREAGFTVYADTSIWITHFNVVRVTPDFDGDTWAALLSVGNHDIVRVIHRTERSAHAEMARA